MGEWSWDGVRQVTGALDCNMAINSDEQIYMQVQQRQRQRQPCPSQGSSNNNNNDHDESQVAGDSGDDLIKT